MKALTFIKTIPKRFLTSLYNTAVKIQNFHNNKSFTLAQAKQAIVKYNAIIQSQYKIKTKQLSAILEQNVSRYPNMLFAFYLIFWVTVHYLFFKLVTFQVKRNQGKGMFEAISYRIAQKNKPFVLRLIKERLFENQQVRKQIEYTFKQIPYNKKIHQSLESALSSLIVSQFIKTNASRLSVNGFKVLVIDHMTEKQLKKLVIHLLNNSYIRKQLKDLILDYLNGQSFSNLVVDQLSALIETAYTKKMLADLVQSTFNSVAKDPYTRYLFLEYVKDWLV